MQPWNKFMFHRVAVFKGELVCQQQLGWLCSCNCICKSFFGGVQSVTTPRHRDASPAWVSSRALILQSGPLAQPPAT